jgi:hypothetical protein
VRNTAGTVLRCARDPAKIEWEGPIPHVQRARLHGVNPGDGWITELRFRRAPVAAENTAAPVSEFPLKEAAHIPFPLPYHFRSVID